MTPSFLAVVNALCFPTLFRNTCCPSSLTFPHYFQEVPFSHSKVTGSVIVSFLLVTLPSVCFSYVNLSVSYLSFVYITPFPSIQIFSSQGDSERHRILPTGDLTFLFFSPVSCANLSVDFLLSPPLKSLFTIQARRMAR